VIGMDWLETHEALLDYKNKKLYFVDDVGHKRILVGKNQGVSLIYNILATKEKYAKRVYLYVVLAMNAKEDSLKLEQYHIVSEFQDVFPKEFPGLPPKRELEFTIELKPGMKPIARTPYG
jgi:hypothetical protein